MKKTTLIFAAFTLLVLSSCSNNNPKAVAQKFVTAFNNGNSTIVKETITTDSQAGWEKMKEGGYATSIANKPKDEKDTYTFKSGETNGDFSTQTYEIMMTAPSVKDTVIKIIPVSLTKENGKWKVILQTTLQNVK